MRWRHLVFSVLLLASISALAVNPQKTGTAAVKDPGSLAARKQDQQPPTEGARAFQRQCSRCHAAPEDFSPRISGTIVRHMRVRAALSQHEEEELLRYFNP